MKRILTTILVGLLLCGAHSYAQGPSKHLLHDAAIGKLQPAAIPVQIGPRAPTVMRRLPFFSGGILTTATEAISGTKSTNLTLSSGTAASVPGQSTNTVGCSERTSQGNVRANHLGGPAFMAAQMALVARRQASRGRECAPRGE